MYVLNPDGILWYLHSSPHPHKKRIRLLLEILYGHHRIDIVRPTDVASDVGNCVFDHFFLSEERGRRNKTGSVAKSS